MVLQVDPGVAQALTLLRGGAAAVEPPAVGDIGARRRNARLMSDAVQAAAQPVAGVAVRHYQLTATDGATLELSWYHRTTSAPGSAALYLHGGGMILGLDALGGLYDHAVRTYVAASGVPMLVVDYRTAPEFGHPVPVEDCYAALLWLVEHAVELGADPARLAVMGDSAGGGLAAAVALLARDRGGPRIAQQLLIYPMLDDRTPAGAPDPSPLLTWTHADNITGWTALLGAQAGTETVSPYAAPARAADLTGLPPAYVDVGDLDLFCDEDLAFARRLRSAGIPTELHLYPGCPHAFDLMAPNSAASQRVIAHRVRRLRAL